MSNNTALKQGGRKDESQSSGGGGGRKTSSLKPPPEQTLKCPRCDSNNTKFCYYNNYNLTQPRHFCKTCRRYWTKGGALRNIPVGGGCRKSKKPKSSLLDHHNHGGQLKLLDGLPPPVMDFQLPPPPPPRLNNHFSTSSYGDQRSSNNNNNNLPFMNLDHPLGFNFPLSMITHHATKQGDHHHHHNQIQSGGSGLANFQEMGFTYTNLTSSIESLSSNLNQDLHWRLQQQQRSATLVGQPKDLLADRPILFQNLEIPKPNPSSIGVVESRKDGSSNGNGNGDVAGGLATECFFDNNYAPVNMQNPTSAMNPENDQINGNVNNWNGIQAWNQMNQYSAFQ